MMRITETVKQLIIINVIFYIGSQFVGSAAYDILALHFPGNPAFKPWQFLSYMFMHAPLDQSPGIAHIIFNMLSLWMFGSMLEQMWGAKKFIFFYISCGVGAAILHTAIDYISYNHIMGLLTETGYTPHEAISLLLENKIDRRWEGLVSNNQFITLLSAYQGTMVGASGAIYGLLAAFAFTFPNIELMMIFVPIPIKAKYFVPGLLAFDMFMGVKGQAVIGQGDGVAHFAHLGGALIGFLMMWYWKKNQYNNRRWN